jgi:hypothetical protein
MPHLKKHQKSLVASDPALSSSFRNELKDDDAWHENFVFVADLL